MTPTYIYEPHRPILVHRYHVTVRGQRPGGGVIYDSIILCKTKGSFAFFDSRHTDKWTEVTCLRCLELRGTVEDQIHNA